MLPQVMHVSPQPGHLTGNDGSEHSFEHSYPYFSPVMYMPQMQNQTLMFQNQQMPQMYLGQNAFGQNTLQPAENTTLMMPQVQVPQPTPTQQPETLAYVTTNEDGGTGETKEVTNTSPTTTTVTPTNPPLMPTVAPAQFMNPLVFPQVPMAPQMPQYVPCVVPGGAFQPTFQPMYFVQQPNPHVYIQPEQHPTMRSHSSHSRHESYDGSEFSDKKSNSLRRFSSDQSRDGYGSDFGDNRSRVGSEQYVDDEDKEGERKPQPQRYNKNNQYSDQSSNKRHHRGRERSRSGSQKRPTSKERQEEMYKTELCSAWVNQKKCRFGHRCIFAHGKHELRSAKRKQDRQKMRPPLKKFLTGLLNKLCEANFEQVITEFMTVCLEEISDHNVNVEGAILMKAFFNKAVAERDLREDLVASLSKLFKSHTCADALKRTLADVCLAEYRKPRNKGIALSTIDLVGLFVSRQLLHEKIVHQILEETKTAEATQMKVELWLKLIEVLKDNVDTSRYFPGLVKFKAMSTRIRFAIMDLEDLQKNNWNPRM